MSLDLFQVDADVIVQDEKDSVGGFQVWDSGVYTGVVKSAYLDAYDGGSKFIEVNIELTNDKGEVLKISEREVVWSAKTKGTYYLDKKTGDKKQLIGLSKMNALGGLLTGKELKDSVFETKVHEVYRKAANGVTPTELPTLVDWTGKVVNVGLLKVNQNKQVKSGTKYVDSNEAVERNEINKVFNENKQTNLEVKDNAPATFIDDWLKANEGKTRNTFKPVAGAPAAGGVPAASSPTIDFNE